MHSIVRAPDIESQQISNMAADRLSWAFDMVAACIRMPCVPIYGWDNRRAVLCLLKRGMACRCSVGVTNFEYGVISLPFRTFLDFIMFLASVIGAKGRGIAE